MSAEKIKAAQEAIKAAEEAVHAAVLRVKACRSSIAGAEEAHQAAQDALYAARVDAHKLMPQANVRFYKYGKFSHQCTVAIIGRTKATIYTSMIGGTDVVAWRKDLLSNWLPYPRGDTSFGRSMILTPDEATSPGPAPNPEAL